GAADRTVAGIRGGIHRRRRAGGSHTEEHSSAQALPEGTRAQEGEPRRSVSCLGRYGLQAAEISPPIRKDRWQQRSFSFRPTAVLNYFSVFRMSARLPNNSSICALLMINGGDSAMMSPFTRISRSFSQIALLKTS